MNIEKERMAYLRKELKEYEKVTPMTDEERKAVRAWVKAGNSVHENDMLACYEGGYPMDYLDTYRDIVYISQATKDMSDEDARKFALAYYGWDDEPDHNPDEPSLEEQLIALGY